MTAADALDRLRSRPRMADDGSVLGYWIAGSLLVGLLQWSAVASGILFGPGHDSLLAAGGFAAIGSLLLILVLPVARLQARRLAPRAGVGVSTFALNAAICLFVVLLWRGTVLSASLLVEIGSLPLAQLRLWWAHVGPWQLQSDLIMYAVLVGGLVVMKRTRTSRPASASSAGPESRGPEPTPADGDTPAAPDLDRLPVRTGNEVRLIPVDEVLWIEGAGSYARIHLNDTSHLTRKTLTELAGRLEPAGFLRVHRSSIVNLRHLESLESAGRGALRARLADGTSVRVASSRTDRLESAIGAIGGSIGD